MGALAAGAIGLVLASAALLRLLPLGQHSTIGVPRIVFAVFGQTTDTLYVAPATKPDERTIIETVPHAEGWGINPAPM